MTAADAADLKLRPTRACALNSVASFNALVFAFSVCLVALCNAAKSQRSPWPSELNFVGEIEIFFRDRSFLFATFGHTFPMRTALIRNANVKTS
jgi:hypothetical protein